MRPCEECGAEWVPLGSDPLPAVRKHLAGCSRTPWPDSQVVSCPDLPLIPPLVDDQLKG